MTTIARSDAAVTAGVDTHLDVHVAAVVNDLGAVLGTRAFPTTPAGYRQLLGWLRRHGDLQRVGVEGTGTYGVGLTRHLTQEGVIVVEVDRPNRQVRRRHGKTDTVDAIAAARAALGRVATGTPKAATGTVEGIRALRLVIRSAHKSRVQAVNQLHALVITAPAAEIDKPTPRSGASSSSEWAPTNPPATTSQDEQQRDCPSARSCAASSDTSPEKSSNYSRKQPAVDTRSITYTWRAALLRETTRSATPTF
jgi:hypothetical protein